MRVSSKINDEWMASKKVSKTVLIWPTKRRKKNRLFYIKINLYDINVEKTAKYNKYWLLKI